MGNLISLLQAIGFCINQCCGFGKGPFFNHKEHKESFDGSEERGVEYDVINSLNGEVEILVAKTKRHILRHVLRSHRNSLCVLCG